MLKSLFLVNWQAEELFSKTLNHKPRKNLLHYYDGVVEGPRVKT